MNPAPRVTKALLAGLLLGPLALAQVPTDPPPWWGKADNQTVSLYWNFDTGLTPTFAVVPAWYNPAVTVFANSGPLSLIPAVSGNALGILGNGTTRAASADLTVDNDPYPDWIKIFWFQFDVLEGTSGSVVSEIEKSLGYDRAIVAEKSASLGNGWDRVTVQAQLVPQPDDEGIDWSFLSTGASVAIDNLFVNSKCVKPGPDETGDAMGDVENRQDVSAALGGARARGVAVTQVPGGALARTYWVSKSGSGSGTNHELVRLDLSGPSPIAIGSTVLAASTTTVPQGPGDLAVETTTNAAGVITQQIVWALIDLRATGGVLTLQGVDAATGTSQLLPIPAFPSVAVVPALTQTLGLTYDPHGNGGLGSFWISFNDAGGTGRMREFARSNGAPLETHSIPSGCAGLAYDDTLGNFYGFSNTPLPTPQGQIQVNGFEWSGYDFQPTGNRFCGDLTLGFGQRGGQATGLEVYRRRVPGQLRAPLTMACVATTDAGTPAETQWIYELSGPFGFGYSVLGRCGMNNGPAFVNTPNFEVTLDGVPNSLFALLFVGFSNSTSAIGPLPFDLQPLLGWEESILSVSPDVSSPLLLPTTTGRFVQPVPIPNNPALGYAPIYFQWLVLDSSITGFFAMTQAGKTVIYP
ncbi:MAG: hypothetical protein JNK15_21865 [Planctomycetes bacterium]|nr:hypothetical protein [Planctomycetota bacterium]